MFLSYQGRNGGTRVGLLTKLSAFNPYITLPVVFSPRNVSLHVKNSISTMFWDKSPPWIPEAMRSRERREKREFLCPITSVAEATRDWEWSCFPSLTLPFPHSKGLTLILWDVSYEFILSNSLTYKKHSFNLTNVMLLFI